MERKTNIQQGLKNNWKQFWLLVLINAFVGSMIGLERAIIPTLGTTVFHINGHTALLSFIIAFGTTKAIFNLLTGKLAQKLSRKKVLTLGWLAAVPVPFLLMFGPSWSWIIFANVLLGINQGLSWSATVIMKIDLVGEKDRGLAMGINEFAGYLSVGGAAYLSSMIAAAKGVAYFPFIPGIFFSMAGLLLTLFWVRDTTALVHSEAQKSAIPLLNDLWKATTWQHKNLGTVTLNGLVNNLNDAVIWGLLPVFLSQKQFTIAQIGLLAGLYPAVWGLGQLITGKLGDHFCKKQLLVLGMTTQAAALLLIAFSPLFSIDLAGILLLGAGTALVYPNFLALIAENTHPSQRARSLGIFRFWRDSGYVIGALVSGILADIFGIPITLLVIALITAGAGMVAQKRMCCTKKLIWKSALCKDIPPVHERLGQHELLPG